MKKIISLVAILLSVALIFSLAGCVADSGDASSAAPAASSEPTADYSDFAMSVACLKGPTGVGMAELMESKEKGEAALDYTFTVASAADEISGKIVSGEINIASVPTNLAAKLYAKTSGQIVMLAVNTLGVLSIIEDGETVNSFADLKGKTIYSTGEGSNPEYILRYVLKENGLDPDKDVTIQFVATNDELNAALISGNASVALVPEPAATTVLTKKDTLRRALSMNDEWSKVSDSKLMMGCVVAKKAYIEENPDQVAAFLKDYEASVKYATDNIDDAASLCEKFQIVPKAAIAKAAIPSCNLTFVSGNDMKDSIKGYFDVLLSFDATSIGGALPGDDFYYNAK